MRRVVAVTVVLLAVTAVAAVAVFAWWPRDSPAGRAPAAELSLPAVESGVARAVLAELPVSEPGSTDGYERDAFGAGWRDPDRNGCDARNDMLRRDLVDVVVRDGTQGCVVDAGTLHDPYTGQSIAFVKGPDSADVQIDHMVSGPVTGDGSIV